jgi:membrane-associated phospholipid phosphatase
VLINHRRVLTIALVTLALAIFLGVLVAFPTTLARVQIVDDWVYDVSNQFQPAPLVWAAKVLALTGSAYVNWPLRVAVILLLTWRRMWVQLLAFVLAVVTSEVILGVMKAAYARPRPPDPLFATTGYSFPSGHAVAAVVTAVGIVIVLLPPGRARTRWEVRAIIFVLVMALSRVYLNAHWLSDVIEGVLIGTALALLFPSVLQSLRVRAQQRRGHTVPARGSTSGEAS